MLTTLTRIDYLPDPTLQVDNHYKPFDEVFGTGASEEHMPSLIITKYKKQYTNETSYNARSVECAECNKASVNAAKENCNHGNQFQMVFQLPCGWQIQYTTSIRV